MAELGTTTSGGQKTRLSFGVNPALRVALAVVVAALLYHLAGLAYFKQQATNITDAVQGIATASQSMAADIEAAAPDLATRSSVIDSKHSSMSAAWRISQLSAVGRALKQGYASAAPDHASELSDDLRTTLDRSVARAAPGLGAKLFGPEQFVCFMLAVWAAMLLLQLIGEIRRQKAAIQSSPLAKNRGALIRPSLAGRLIADLRTAADDGSAIHRIALPVLRRFEVTNDVSAADSIVRTEIEGLAFALNAKLGMVRFAIWAIPAIGFIGTVRGIGSALSVASGPEQLPAVVGYLGVAFDTTFFSLLLSIVLMLAMLRTEQRLDEFVGEISQSCHDLVVRRLQVETSVTPQATSA